MARYGGHAGIHPTGLRAAVVKAKRTGESEQKDNLYLSQEKLTGRSYSNDCCAGGWHDFSDPRGCVRRTNGSDEWRDSVLLTLFGWTGWNDTILWLKKWCFGVETLFYINEVEDVDAGRSTDSARDDDC